MITCTNAEDCIAVPEILLPQNCDMHSWAVNACDQFTSDKSYWEQVRDITRGKKSAYELIFPEIYLKDNPEKRIEQINEHMREYIKDGVFKSVKGGFILVERTTASGVRKGIVLAVDLEYYSFLPQDKALIRSTEATVLDRLPPRVAIRKNAPLELPHIMLLYDDPSFSVLKAAERGEVLYDFELNMGGGRVKGTYIKNAAQVKSVFGALAQGDGDKMLFAVGDGNHSLAAAKLCWEEVKKGLTDAEQRNHPARFALCEAVNIYDEALSFHPIFRYVKTQYPEKFIQGWHINGESRAAVVFKGGRSILPFESNIPNGIKKLDSYIEEFIAAYGGEADYIHGEDQLAKLRQSGVGIEVPPIEKSDFFRLIKEGGNLPKKTFSMGEGNEKRYYIEAKRIK